MADSHAQARAERIREAVEIAGLLEELGYAVRGDGGHREQQYACDLHGSGQDNKPSARVYPDSNSTYCFACDVSRDPIGLVRDVKDLSFWDSIKWLEGKYKLPPIKWEGPVRESAGDVVRTALRTDRTFEDDYKRISERLTRLTHEKALALTETLAFWGALDKTSYHVRGSKGQGGPWSEKQGRQVLAELQGRILKALRRS